MQLWRNIPDLYTGTPVNIFLRSISEPFWQHCIDRVEIVKGCTRRRVCAVGTSGTGKTFTTPLLIRMLLLQGSTVVYIRKSIDRSSWFYEFIPTSNINEPGEEIAVTVNVYPEETHVWGIPSFKDTSAYYVVDPGSSMRQCDPGAFPPRVILVSSPTPEHWGNYYFRRSDGRQVGVFQYYPLWTLAEVLGGLDGFYSGVPLSSQEVAERYRHVGGVPGNLFAGKELYQNILETLDNAVQAVEPKESPWNVRGWMNLLNKMPSAAMGIELANNDHGTFTEEKEVLISTAVAEMVFTRHIRTLWDDMVVNERPLVLETYLRPVLSTAGSNIAVQLIERGTRTSGRSTDVPPTTIGGCSGIQIVPEGESIVKAALESPTANISFYSADPHYPLIDFVCRDNAGNVLAFQATTSATHTVDEAEIAALEDEVKDRSLMLYYLHAARSEQFTTDPITPTTRSCWIFHVEIPKPTPN